MTLSNLYFRGCFEQPSDEQKDAIEATGVVAEVADKGCFREDVNTCGMSLEQLFGQYSIYDPQRGLYKSWGDIEFPWQIDESTPNLIISETDDKWSVAKYRSVIAYSEGSRVLVIEEDGYKISLYQANQDILAITGAFDKSKWDHVCHVRTTTPAGVRSLEELISLYNFYELKFFDTEWGKYQVTWDQTLKSQTLQSCVDQGLTLLDLQKCLLDGSSDEWNEARVRRDFFYREGEIVLVNGRCGDVACLYIATQDIPATEEIFESEKHFDPQSPRWQRIYCVPTGRNKCLEYQRKKEPSLGYDVVEIGSKGHFVEVPVPYRLKPPTPTLDELAESSDAPKVLTQAEIDSLTQPTEGN